MGHKQKSRNHEPTRARHEQTLIFRVLCFVFFRVTRVVNDFLCPNVVSFDLGHRTATPTAHAIFFFDEEADEEERKAEDQEREEHDPPRHADAFGKDGRRGGTAMRAAKVSGRNLRLSERLDGCGWRIGRPERCAAEGGLRGRGVNSWPSGRVALRE
jgi:hypothetical protein